MRITTSSRLMRVMSTCNGQRSDSCRGDGHSGITADTAPGWLGGRMVSELDSGAQGKGKVFPYSLPSVGPGADPGVQAVSPQVT